MKVLTLNTWAGCLPDLVPYLTEQAEEIDVLCLQEVHRANDDFVPQRYMPRDPGSRPGPVNLHLYNQLTEVLYKSHRMFFAPQLHGGIHDMEATEFAVDYGNALFVRREITILEQFNWMVYAQGPEETCSAGFAANKSAQAVVLDHNGTQVLVAHTHGAWWYSNKGDVVPRRQQFGVLRTRIDEVRRQYPAAKLVLCGDFNQHSETDLIRCLPHWQAFGCTQGRNLNTYYGVTSTRTRHYDEDKPHREADYVIAHPGLEPTLYVDRKVPSDHAGLLTTLTALA